MKKEGQAAEDEVASRLYSSHLPLVRKLELVVTREGNIEKVSPFLHRPSGNRSKGGHTSLDTMK